MDIDEVVARPVGTEKVDSESTRHSLQQAIEESFVSGFRVVILICTVMALAGGLVSWLVIETKSLQGKESPR